MLDRTDRPLGERRRFLAAATAAGIGLTATRMLMRNAQAADLKAPSRTTKSGFNTVTYADAQEAFPGVAGKSANEIVLNYALTLERLEADLYRQALNAASGLKLSTPLSSKTSYTLKIDDGGLSKSRRAAAFAYLQEFSFVEAAHRDYLIAAIPTIGGTPVGANPQGYAFTGGSPGADLKTIMTNILGLEETGVRAYLGAIGYLNDASLAVIAGTIYSTEARHSAAVAATLGLDAGPRNEPGDQLVTGHQPEITTFEHYYTPGQVLTAVKPLFR